MASIITFGGQPCLDPLVERDNCARLGLPVVWFGRPNSYACPLGHQTGEGWILLSRQALDALGLNTQYDLTFSLTGASQGNAPLPTATVTHKNLHIVGAKCLTPGVRSDTAAAYLVELADRRRLARARPINKAYNVRSQPGAADYFSATLNSGSAWTWATMASDIWSAVGTDRLGTFPGLPFTPDGTPENFAFHGTWLALDALGLVLARIGCALKLDTITDTFSVVRLQSTDAAATAALAAHDHLRVLDDEVQAPVIGRVPQYARVVFAKQMAAPDTTGGSSFLVSDVADAGAALAGVDTGSYAILYDDLPAVYDSAGSNTNSAAVATRAAERAADYFRQARAERFHRVYSTPLADTALRPGATIQATRWGDRGRGMVTEIGRFPGTAGGNPFAMPGTSGGGSSGGGSGDELFFNDTTTAGDQYTAGGPTNVFLTGGPNYHNSYAWNSTTLLQFLYYYLSSYSWTFAGPVELCSDMYWCSDEIPSWATDQDNLALPSHKIVFTIAGDTNVYLGGIAALNENHVIALVNRGTSTVITLKHQAGTSDAAKRFSLPGARDMALYPGQSVILWYDGDALRWRAFAPTGLLVEDTDSSPSYPTVNLRLSFDSGFTVDNPSLGVTRVYLTEADATHVGTVNTTTQTFGGAKSFPDGLSADGTITLLDQVSLSGATLPPSYTATVSGALSSALGMAAGTTYLTSAFHSAGTSYTTEVILEATTTTGTMTVNAPVGTGASGALGLVFTSYTAAWPTVTLNNSGGARTGQSTTQGGLVFTSGWLTGGSLSVDTASLANNAVTYAIMQDVAALSLIGNPTNGSTDPSAITAASDHQVMRRSGAALAFGAVNLAQSAAVTGALPALNGGTGVDGSAAANGTTLIGNGSGYTLATLTQGSGVTITNGAGTITIAATGLTDGDKGDIVVSSSGTVWTIDSGYVGQTSITTLGTITTGTWNGAKVEPAYGGTGVVTVPSNGYLLIGNGSTGKYVCAAPGSGNNNISYATGAGSLDILSKPNLYDQTTITADTTLTTADRSVMCNNSAANITVTLFSASGLTGRRLTIKKTNSAAKTVTIDGNASETIDGATTLVLYCQYDAVEIEADGTNWFIVSDSRRAHRCRLRRATAQTMTNGAVTRVLFATADYDVGGIGDITTDNRVEILRAGQYRVSGFACLGAVMDAGERMSILFYKNGTAVMDSTTVSSQANDYIRLNITDTMDCAAGDTIDLRVYQFEGADQSLETALELQARLAVEEIRP